MGRTMVLAALLLAGTAGHAVADDYLAEAERGRLERDPAAARVEAFDLAPLNQDTPADLERRALLDRMVPLGERLRGRLRAERGPAGVAKLVAPSAPGGEFVLSAQERADMEALAALGLLPAGRGSPGELKAALPTEAAPRALEDAQWLMALDANLESLSALRTTDARFVEARRSANTNLAAAQALAARRDALSFGWLRRAGFSLRRAFGEPADKQGAVLTWERDIEAGSSLLTAEFCAKWTAQWDLAAGSRAWRVSPVLAFEGDLTTGKTKDHHHWTAIAGVEAAVSQDGRSFDGAVSRHTRRIYGHLVGSFTRTQDGDVETADAELRMTPVVGSWALGVRRGHETLGPVQPDGTRAGVDERGCCIPGTNWFSWQWDLSAQVTGGGYMDEPAKQDVEELYVRPGVTVGGHLYFDAVGRWLGHGWDSRLYPMLEVLYTAIWRPLESRTYSDRFEAVLKVPLAPAVGIDLTYANGYADLFLGAEETVAVRLDIRF